MGVSLRYVVRTQRLTVLHRSVRSRATSTPIRPRSSSGRKSTTTSSSSPSRTRSPPKPSTRSFFSLPPHRRSQADVGGQDFAQDSHFAKHWTGLRQDSGDPFAYAPRAKEVYERLGVDYRTKMIIFSDALTVEKALALKKQCDELAFKCTSLGGAG